MQNTTVTLTGDIIKHVLGEQIKNEIEVLSTQVGRPPCLAVIQVGESAESKVYVNQKRKECKDKGIRFIEVQIPSSYGTEESIINEIQYMNSDPEIDGIIVQLPILSYHKVDTNTVLNSIHPDKDVDGLGAVNMGRQLQNDPTALYPCTALGVIQLLDQCGVFNGYYEPTPNILVIGKGRTSGKPLTTMLMNMGYNVTNISSKCGKSPLTLHSVVARADVIISCVGKHLLDPDMIKKGAILINVGMHKDPETNKLKGDYDFDEMLASGKPRCVTTITRSTGILTVMHLLNNVLKAYKFNVGR